MPKDKPAPVKARAPISMMLSGLVCVEVAPGVKFCTSDPTAKVVFSWDTGSSSGSWTNVSP